MVNLVLDAAGHNFFALDDHVVAFDIGSDGFRVPGALRWEEVAGNGEASLFIILVLIVGQVNDFRVENVSDLPVDVPGEGAEGNTDLVRCQSCPPFIVNCFEEVLDKGFNLGRDLLDLVAHGTQNGVADHSDIAVSHGAIIP